MRILLVGAAILAAGCGGGGRLEGGPGKPAAGTGGELEPSAGGAAGGEEPGTGGSARGGDGGGTGAGTAMGGTGGTLAGSPGAAGHAQAGAGGTAGAASTGGSGRAGSSSGGQAGTTSAGGMPSAGTGGDGLGGSTAGAGGSAGAAAGSGGSSAGGPVCQQSRAPLGCCSQDCVDVTQCRVRDSSCALDTNNDGWFDIILPKGWMVAILRAHGDVVIATDCADSSTWSSASSCGFEEAKDADRIITARQSYDTNSFPHWGVTLYFAPIGTVQPLGLGMWSCTNSGSEGHPVSTCSADDGAYHWEQYPYPL